jgi:hypothetical protein
MARTASLVCLVSIISVYHKKTLEKQAQVVGTKQSRQAIKADRLLRLSGCQADKAVRPACFVMGLLLKKWMSNKLICVEQSTSMCSIHELLHAEVRFS